MTSKQLPKMLPKGSKIDLTWIQNHSKVDLGQQSRTFRKHRYLQCSRHFGTSKMPLRDLKTTLQKLSNFRPQKCTLHWSKLGPERDPKMTKVRFFRHPFLVHFSKGAQGLQNEAREGHFEPPQVLYDTKNT